MLKPKDAFEESPMLRSREESVLFRMQGTPPRTTTKNMYCLEYSKMLSLAPRSLRSGVMQSRHSKEYAAADRSARR